MHMTTQPLKSFKGILSEIYACLVSPYVLFDTAIKHEQFKKLKAAAKVYSKPTGRRWGRREEITDCVVVVKHLTIVTYIVQFSVACMCYHFRAKKRVKGMGSNSCRTPATHMPISA